MDLGIGGRVAIVEASSKGLGRAVAMSLAREGCRVVICARGEEALTATAADIEAAGGTVLAIPADVVDPATPARLVEAATERFGGVHIVVANAGGPPPGGPFDHDDDAYRAVWEANALASMRLVRAAVPALRQAGWGRICLITSVTVKQPAMHLALSSAARAGLWGWAKLAATELRPDGITLNLACPGTHATDRMRELGIDPAGTGDPADFGDVVAFLCSRQAGYMTGTAVSVDGGAVAGLL